MNKGGQRVLCLALAYGLLAVGVGAQEPTVEEKKEEAAGQEPDTPVFEEPLPSGEENDTVVLSPWRVGDVKAEERKEELQRRRERVLREAEKKKRALEQRKKRTQERAQRVKRETNLLCQTNY